jgi:small subunit ribosomal protein S17
MFHSAEQHLVHDPNNSLITGDVVELHRLHVSKRVRHVVASVVAPFGTPLESRPPIPTPDDRLAAYKASRFRKFKRRELRAKAAEGDEEAIKALIDLGLDPGVGAEPGVSKENDGKGIKLGEKGQKLPSKVLPGGKHEVGKINDRAQHNKGKQIKRDALAEDRLLEAKEKREALEERDLGTESVLR